MVNMQHITNVMSDHPDTSPLLLTNISCHITNHTLSRLVRKPLGPASVLIHALKMMFGGESCGLT